ncbi:MAG: tetratricopeptide repeat protein [Prevotellaceae bacterium]|jgi:hypothetical protein|nr:tetratricopeptide repeat protein [Prevotellaceae bacterium]
MTPATLQHWIQHPEALNRETLYELRTLVARYPYFQTLHQLYLKNLYLLHDSSFGEELRRSVLYVADRQTLFYLIEGYHYVIHAYPATDLPPIDSAVESAGVDRTSALIDAFLAQVPEEHALMPIPDYSMDYSAYLLRDDTEPASTDTDIRLSTPVTPPLREQELIDDFLSGTQPVTADTEPVAPADNDAEESCFTETLAKIYIKQQRYEKALEIIKRLSLNYPKKNAYFADQIRFLEKLIINAKSK